MKIMKNFLKILVFVLTIYFFFSHPRKASAALNWQEYAGSGVGKGLVTVMRYYPQTITINEGDSITWTVEGDAHTISFLSGSPVPDPFSAQAQQPAGGKSYGGAGFVSSGIIEPGNTFTLTFTKAGTFTYNCLIHPGMTATVVVQPGGAAYPHKQSFYNQEHLTGKSGDISRGLAVLNTVEANLPVQNSDGSLIYSVTAGIGNGTESAMRFFPQVQIIKEGDSITWSNKDPMMPHTVSFPGSDGNIPESFTPAGDTSYDGSVFTSSGILMPNRTYTLKFTKQGRYSYECLLHDQIGMRGTVIVVRK